MNGLSQNCENIAPLLRMYHTFLRTLSLEGLPRLVYQLAGELGFGALAKLYAETTRNYIDNVLRVPQSERTPEKLLSMMKEAMEAASSIVDEPLFEFSLEKTDNKLRLRLPVKKRDRLDTLRAAPVLGIIAGVLEASGYKVYIVADASKKNMAPRTGQTPTAVVALTDCGPASCIEAELRNS
jgi:hypothetical protein